MASTAKDKEVKRNWPVVTGIEANSKHEGRQSNLVPTHGSLVPRSKKVGL